MRKNTFNYQYPSYWSHRQWFYWLLCPTVLLVVVAAIFLLHLPIPWAFADLQQIHYWQPQIQWFISFNSWLTMLLPQSLWFNLTLLGDGWVLLPLSFLFIYRSPQAAAAIWFALPIAAALSWAGKTYFSMPRPATVLDHASFTIIGDSVSGLTSLPSGHSITYAAVAATLLATFMPRPKQVTEWSFFGLVGLVLVLLCSSRIAVGAHWILDTLMGAGLGGIAGVLGAGIVNKHCRWWQTLYSSKWRFFHVPIYFLWMYALFMHSFTQSLTPWVIGLSIGACGLLVYWPWSKSAVQFRCYINDTKLANHK